MSCNRLDDDEVEVLVGTHWRRGWLDPDTWHRGHNGRWRAVVRWDREPAEHHVDDFEQDDIRKVDAHEQNCWGRERHLSEAQAGSS